MSGGSLSVELMRAFVYLALGLIVTPVVTYLLGFALFGARDTWNVGQGDSFLVFFVALWAAPFGALYWALVVLVQNTLEGHVRPGRVFLLALALYLLGIVAALVATDVHFS